MVSLRSLPWAQLIIEALFVVFGVLLALWVNDLYQAQQNLNLADRALRSVVAEVNENCDRIRSHSRYHTEVLSEIRAPHGIQIGLLTNDAWSSAISTGASVHVKFEVASAIGAIAASQGDHRTVVQSYLQALFSHFLANNQGAVVHSQGEKAVISELVQIQNKLTSQYAALGTLIEKHYAGKDALAVSCKQKTA